MSQHPYPYQQYPPPPPGLPPQQPSYATAVPYDQPQQYYPPPGVVGAPPQPVYAATGGPPGARPPLPPRPARGPPSLAAYSSLNFPPPPRSPNRPPVLPPEPQNTYGQPYGQPGYQPGYSQPATQMYGQPQQGYPSWPQQSYQPQQYTQTYQPPQPAYAQPYAPGYQSPPVSSPLATGSSSIYAPPAQAYATLPVLQAAQAPVWKPVQTPAQTPAQTTHIDQRDQHSQPSYDSQAQPPIIEQPAATSITQTVSSSPAPQADPIHDVGQQLQSMSLAPDHVQPGAPAGPSELSTEPAIHQAVVAPPAPVPVDKPPPPVRQSTTAMSATISGPLQTPTNFNASSDAAPEQKAQPEIIRQVPAQPDTQENVHSPPPTQSLSVQKPQISHQGLLHTPSGLWAVTACIQSPMTFATTWYTHKDAPEFTVCSRCYVDYIWPTVFRDEFTGTFLSDKKARRCRCEQPRWQALLKQATATGQLQPLVTFMAHRAAVADCFGTKGCKGTAGVQWFRARDGEMPGFVVCEACFEDIVLAFPAFVPHLEPAIGHAAQDTWACDMAIGLVLKEFKERGATGDWATFIAEAMARLSIPACPENTLVMRSSRKWFTPVRGPFDLILCAACYCDHILKTGQEHLWEDNAAKKANPHANLNNCCLGQFNILMAMCAVEEDKADMSWDGFWHAIDRIAHHEPACTTPGAKDARWLTFASQPDGFCVCGACAAGILEPLGLQRFFVPRTAVPGPDAAWLCSLHRTAARFPALVRGLLETWYMQDSSNWEAFVQTYATIPECPRNNDHKGRMWHGWPECTICPECYHDFVRGTALDTDATMPLRHGKVLDGSYTCEMYSPRMRALYTAACASSDASALLQFAEQRRAVYWQTMPRYRLMLAEFKFKANQVMMLRMQSVLYQSIGGIVSASSAEPPAHTYSEAGVGSGFENEYALDGARFGVQADQMSVGIAGGPISVAGLLEAQWQAVE